MVKSLTICKQHLIIFTRYPEVGKTKTRLIPALGAASAADLHRQMTEHTLLKVREWQKTTAVSVEVRFAGGSLSLMQEWLGEGLIYHEQGEGDLGERMWRSLSFAFNLETEQAVIIGTDCPGINAKILTTAFEQLYYSDLVLGPALDGGYYLIGLRQPAPELFSHIHWGSSAVFNQTRDIAQKQNLSFVCLNPLADVDRPEDLLIWQQIIREK
ncbi:MAG TPA: TIGR04282 family arsenosugar biosynthesis glycosyltransferase [Nostocaceae cyanobacterium]|nr:TIGR04282 family arsenosugar biosynthesis glycosyltransferase [Nostocaceae cyanobacterium]